MIPKEMQHSGLLCGKEERFKKFKVATPGPGSYSVKSHFVLWCCIYFYYFVM